MAKKDTGELTPLSDALMEVMTVVWKRGEVTVSEVRKDLPRELAGNTVQTMMSRLVEKGWLTHRREGRAFVYTPAVPRSSTLQNLVNHVVDKAFEGSADGLFMALLNGRGLTDKEQNRIQALIDASREEGEQTDE